MTSPVVTVTPDTEVAEIARLLAIHGIKRVPVVLDDRLVGIVSRADLLRALASEPEHGHTAIPSDHRLLGALGGHLLHGQHDKTAPAQVAPPEPALSAEAFRTLVADHGHEESAKRAAQQREAAERRRARVKDLIDHHVGEPAWQAMLHKARQAAQAGETEALLFTFPASLCSDGGRAINVPEPEWPTTLRGEAAEIYLRWQHELRPQGFHLAARILDFPGGLPGDVGLFLIWGG
ncbi:MAG: CBS domain-containing protein [Proteobacteria bacterium]|nr:CBS domain-containing protein [Pseudomonadota bacterium]